MSLLSARPRRAADDVLGRAAVTGLVAGGLVGYLSMAAFAVGQTWADGEALPTAVGAALLAAEDWEIMPFWLLGAVLLGGVVAAVASAAWMAVHRRTATRVWPANVAGAAVAAGLAGLVTAVGFAPLTLPTVVLVLVASLAAGPWVCLRRVRPVQGRDG